MSDKMECPGCGAYSSSVIGDANNGDPCRFCGLSDAARSEIWKVRAKKADADVTTQCEALIKRNVELEELQRGYQRRFEAAYEALAELPPEPR